MTDALNPDLLSDQRSRILDPGKPGRHVKFFMTLATNIAHYPEWTAYLKEQQPRTLIVWGQNDPLFAPAAPEIG